MVVTIPAEVVTRYRRFSLYNSPFVAHDSGRAIDLYPDGDAAPSPVAGEVLDVKRVRAPPKPYAPEHDYLILVDDGERIARILHVEPSVEPGDSVAVGDSLGALVRAGFFAPWVPNHLHLGFRDRGVDPYRASGSLPVAVDVAVEALSWDGTGTVAETGACWARLDAPVHPAPGEGFVGLANEAGGPDQPDGVLDGGLPHYAGGGLVGGTADRAVLAGSEVGTASGRDVDWHDLTVLANGAPVTGLALFCARDDFGVKLVGEDLPVGVGDDVVVEVVRPSTRSGRGQGRG